MNLSGSGVLAAAGIVAAGVGAVWLYKNRELFNPASDKNIVYQGVNAPVKIITGGAAAGGEDTLGGAFARLREWLSGDDKKIRDMLKGASPAPSSSADFQKTLEDTWL